MTRPKFPTSGKFILVDKKPVEVFDLFEWADWFENFSNRRIKLTKIGKKTISTIFFGVDNGQANNTPLLFETVVFGKEYYRRNSATYLQALKHHEHAVKWAVRFQKIEKERLPRKIKKKISRQIKSITK